VATTYKAVLGIMNMTFSSSMQRLMQGHELDGNGKANGRGRRDAVPAILTVQSEQ